MEKSLPDAGQVEGIDPQKPILLGFSAGGQAALTLWSSDPARLGGLVVDAAYPIRVELGPEGGVRQATLSPPDSPAVKSVPIYVLVGEADQGGRGLGIWREVESPWRKAGVPLTIHSVAGKGQAVAGRPPGSRRPAGLVERDQEPVTTVSCRSPEIPPVMQYACRRSTIDPRTRKRTTATP